MCIRDSLNGLKSGGRRLEDYGYVKRYVLRLGIDVSTTEVNLYTDWIDGGYII